MKRSRSIGVALLLGACVFVTNCGIPDQSANEEVAIRAASREWNEAEAAKDREKCVSFYADDGARFARGSPLRPWDRSRRRLTRTVQSEVPGTPRIGTRPGSYLCGAPTASNESP